jgi:phosphate-selective porin
MGLPWISESGRRYLHLVAAYRRNGADDGKLRYKGGLVDLDDKTVRGGYLTKWSTGVNWWANRRIRITAPYGRATLDRLDLFGHTNQFFGRLQWVY